MFNVNIHEKKRKEKKKHLNGKNHLYHHNASVHKILTFLKSDFHFFFSSRFLKQYACVCVCVVVVFVFVPLLQTRTHAHTRTTNIRTLTHSNTHHMSSFFFLVEKDMAQWRDTPPLGRTHRSPGGDGGEGGEGSLPRLPGVFQLTGTLSKRKRDGERWVSFFFFLVSPRKQKLRYCS